MAGKNHRKSVSQRAQDTSPEFKGRQVTKPGVLEKG